MTTLLAHLASKTRAEDLATDALTYILNQPTMLPLLTAFIGEISPAFPSIIDVVSRKATDGLGVPDISARTTSGILLFIENKFWAGLTEHQPLSYLKALPNSGLLLFVVPNRRVNYIWGLLIEKIKSERGVEHDLTIGSGDLRYGEINQSKKIAITSWRRLLHFLNDQARTLGYQQIIADLAQLQGLCDLIDRQHDFVPFTQENLSDQDTPRRMLGLLSLMDEVFQKCEEDGIFVRRRTMPTDSTATGSEIRFNDNVWAWFGVWWEKWSQHGQTPLWVQFHKPGQSVQPY